MKPSKDFQIFSIDGSDFLDMGLALFPHLKGGLNWKSQTSLIPLIFCVVGRQDELSHCGLEILELNKPKLIIFMEKMKLCTSLL